MAERRFRDADTAFGHQDPDLAVFGLAERVGADRVAAEPPLGFPGQLGLGEKMADGRIRSGEPNARSLTDKAAAAVAADEILCPQRPAVAERDVDAGRVLGEARDLDAAEDRHAELFGPVQDDALTVLLDEREAVRVAARECADVEAHAGEAEHLHWLSFGEEPVGDAALIEHLDGAGMEAERAGLDALLVHPPFDDDDVDAGELQLGAEHQPGRAAAGNDHSMVDHEHTSASCRRAFYGMTGDLKQAPCALHVSVGEGAFALAGLLPPSAALRPSGESPRGRSPALWGATPGAGPKLSTTTGAADVRFCGCPLLAHSRRSANVRLRTLS